MSAATILALVQALTTLVPAAITAASELRSQMSTEDQATLDAALAKLQAQRQADVAQAEADLNAAAAQ